MSSISFKSVEKYFGDVQVLTHFNLDILDGEFISILGPSGCGKTTCLRMLSGLDKNTSGCIKIDEQVISDPENNIFVPPEKRKIGMVFQSYAVWPHMNVFNNIAYPLKVAGKSKDEIKLAVRKVMIMVELDGYGNRMPNQLSGGQQQRVALARGLVMRPRALLLDEPLSNLDAKLRGKMRRDIRQIQQELKLTVVYVTHDQLEATTMSDRMVIMDHGNIQQVGRPDEIQQNPANEFVRDFLNQ